MPTAMRGPELITLHHEDFDKDFKDIAGPQEETKADLAQVRGERRCHRCGIVGARALKVCTRCKYTHYCSKQCQVADWPEHKAKCRTPVVANGSRGEEYPDLAMKFATRLPACPLLIHLLQIYAIINMSLLTDLSKANTHMLRVTLSTQPADILAWVMSDDKSNLEVMLKFVKLESVPLSLTPAMLVELAETKVKAAGRHWIIPLMFTNGVKDFFLPSLVMESSFSAAKKREPLIFRTRLTGDTEVPFGEEGLHKAMDNFVLMDKKNQFKLRAVPK